jgi:hypothetical protein
VAILTEAEIREHITTSLVSDALMRLADAAEEAIVERAGPALDDYIVTDVTQRFMPRGDVIMLGRRATDVVAVVEYAHQADPTTLAADDHALSSSGNLLRRLRSGTNPATSWRPAVDVTYTPYTDAASRGAVQLQLIRLEIAFSPALAMQVIGSWTEQYTTGKPYAEQREGILAALGGEPAVIF